MTTVAKGDFVELEFTGRANGEIFDTNNADELKKINPKAEPKKTIVAIGQGMVVSGLDSSLEGKEIGKEYNVLIKSGEAFGPRKRELVKVIPLKVFTEKKVYPQAGMVLTLDDMLVKIIAVSGARVTVDFNNPLAGKDLDYKFKILRKVESDEEKSLAVFEVIFKFVPEFTVGEKITIKGPKIVEAFVKAYGSKFKEIVGKELAFELEEKKEIGKEDKQGAEKEEEKIKESSPENE